MSALHWTLPLPPGNKASTSGQMHPTLEKAKRMKINDCPLSTDSRRSSICVTKLLQFHVLTQIQIVLDLKFKSEEFEAGLWHMEQKTLNPNK